MPGRVYMCDECSHRFRTPDDTPQDVRALMCPACGSNDVSISMVAQPRPVVMRARKPAVVGDWWLTPRDSNAS